MPFVPPARIAGRIVIVALAGIVLAIPFIGVTLIPPRLTGFVLPDLLIGDHPEIVIRELEIILLLDALAIEMGIMRQLAVFFEKLGRVAACPAVDTVQRRSTASATSSASRWPPCWRLLPRPRLRLFPRLLFKGSVPQSQAWPSASARSA